MKIAILCFLLILVVVMAQRPPKPTSFLPKQWSAYFDYQCGPFSCSGNGYVQYDLDAGKIFWMTTDPHSSSISQLQMLSVYDNDGGKQYLYTSNRCEKGDLQSITQPDFLGGAFYQGNSNGVDSYKTLYAPFDYALDLQDYHMFRVIRVNNDTGASKPVSFTYHGPISLEDHDSVTMTFRDFESGPDSIEQHYFNIPQVCN